MEIIVFIFGRHGAVHRNNKRSPSLNGIVALISQRTQNQYIFAGCQLLRFERLVRIDTKRLGHSVLAQFPA
jgi:hypothetical protein